MSGDAGTPLPAAVPGDDLRGLTGARGEANPGRAPDASADEGAEQDWNEPEARQAAGRRLRVPPSHHGSMDDCNDYSLMCMASCNVITVDLYSGAVRMGRNMDPVFARANDCSGRLGGALNFEVMNACFARATTDAVLDWVGRSQNFERVHMAYSALFESAGQFREQIAQVAGELAQAHMETRDLERPRILFPPLTDDLAGFRITAEADLTSEANLERVFASARNANWLTRMDEQYVRMREGIASLSFEDFARDYRADYASRAGWTANVAAPPQAGLGGQFQAVVGTNPISMEWVRLSATITNSTIATNTIPVTSFPGLSTTTGANSWMSTACFQVASTSYAAAPMPDPRPNGAERRKKRAALRRGRRALVRSMALYRRFRGADEIRTFVKGGVVTISGHLYDYEVQKKRKGSSVLEATMRPPNGVIPYRLTMLSKDGTRLANGCVYFADTPIFDQILALALHVQDREEELALHRSTVWTGRTPAFEADPILARPQARPMPREPYFSDVPVATGDTGQFAAAMRQGDDWRREWLRLKSLAMIAVRDHIRSRLAIPLAVVEFMEEPIFGLQDLLDDTPDDTMLRTYEASVALLRIAMGIGADLPATLALVSALSGVCLEDLADPGTAIPGLTSLSGEPFARPQAVPVGR